MKRASCPDLSLLLGYLRGEISEQETRQIEEHLAPCCTECEGNLELLRRTGELGRTELETAPEWVVDRALSIPDDYPDGRRVRARQEFDSRELEVAGVRRSETFSKDWRAVWSSDTHKLEIKVEYLDDVQALVIGQVTPAGEKAEVTVLRNGDIEKLSHIDDRGQFLMDLERTDNGPRTLVLCIGEHEIELSLDI